MVTNFGVGLRDSDLDFSQREADGQQPRHRAVFGVCERGLGFRV